jgi:F-type H+/Na+-transporting ATPase subunit alpha
VPATGVSRFEAALLKHVRDEHPEILDEIKRTGELPEALAAKVRAAITAFKTQYKA